MESIEVTALFDPTGHITPLSFVWKERKYRVEGTGRRWEAKDGLHILVMSEGNQVYHLIFQSDSGIWKLVYRNGEPLQGQI
jgi:hypothetical protein